jgi:hypothetical protein|tara:strand:+ start:2391 stop:2789 length:399 start_codon:yes stop_codon:yes gene_type:complete
MNDKCNLNSIERILNKIEKDKKTTDDTFKNILLNVVKKDESKLSYEILMGELSEDEKDYFIKNEAYKNYISQYSKEYIEMSDWYYGPELPYKIYLKEFRKDKQTYLDDKESIKELYSLFMFYGLLQYYLPSD